MRRSLIPSQATTMWTLSDMRLRRNAARPGRRTAKPRRKHSSVEPTDRVPDAKRRNRAVTEPEEAANRGAAQMQLPEAQANDVETSAKRAWAHAKRSASAAAHRVRAATHVQDDANHSSRAATRSYPAAKGPRRKSIHIRWVDHHSFFTRRFCGQEAARSARAIPSRA